MKKKISLLIVFFIFYIYSIVNAQTWPVPTSEKIGGAYGDYRGVTVWGFHTGIDIEAPRGTEVKAVLGGTVEIQSSDQLRIEVSPGVYHCYAHIKNIIPADGSQVSTGDPIAQVGAFDSYDHLHFNLEDAAGNPTIGNPLNILSVDDTVSPTVEGIWFRSQDGTKYFETTAPTISDAIIIWSKIDIISKVSDVIGQAASVKPGIYKIGYQIPESPSGVSPITTTQWLVEFAGALPPADKQDDVYSEDAKCPSDQHELYYIVTNTNQNVDIYWNTKQKLGGGLSDDAKINSEARFPDGIYKVKIDAQDFKGNTDTTDKSKKKVLLDNFRPYVHKVTVIQDGEQKYYAYWELVGDQLVLTPTTQEARHPKPLKSGKTVFKIEFSESVQNPTLSFASSNIPLVAGINTNNKIWLGVLDIPDDGSMDGKDLPITITAEDLAGNKILKLTNEDTIDPSTQITRDATGNMQGIGGEDIRHRVNVDTTPPNIDITGVKAIKIDDEAQIYEGIYANTPLTGSYTVTDNIGIEQVSASSSGNPVVSSNTSQDFVFDNEGCNYIKVKAKDLAGNIAERGINFVIDKTKPLIYGLPYGSCVRTKRPTITAIAKDSFSGVKTLSIFLDGRLVATVRADAKAENTCPVPATILTASYTPDVDLSVGTHTVKATATDRAGNLQEKEWSFTITDNPAPQIDITGVEEGYLQCSVPLEVEYNVTDTDLVGVVATSSGETSSGFNTSTKRRDKFIFKNDCDQYIEVRATDECGTETKIINFKIDIKPPDPPKISGPGGLTIVEKLIRNCPCEKTVKYPEGKYTFSSQDNKTPKEELSYLWTLCKKGDTECEKNPMELQPPSNSITHEFTHAGTYILTVKAKDKCGHTSKPTIKNIDVTYSPVKCPFCPDETESVSNIPIESISHTEGPAQIAILESGFEDNVGELLSLFKEPFDIISFTASAQEMKKYKVVIIPSSGLEGMEKSEIFRANLDEYVKHGGIIISFTTPQGEEWTALPGGIQGYGAAQDMYCFANSAQISEYHPVLAGQKDLTFDGGIDGFFTMWPENAKVLLKRTKNNMPALILYPYGSGYVIATTLYTDYSYIQGSVTQDEIALFGDIISWCKNPKEYIEARPNEQITVPLTIANNTDIDAIPVKFIIKDAKGNILKEETIPVYVEPHTSITYNYTFTAPEQLGIHSIYYELLTPDLSPITSSFADNFAVSLHLQGTAPAQGLAFSVIKQKMLIKV